MAKEAEKQEIQVNSQYLERVFRVVKRHEVDCYEIRCGTIMIAVLGE